MLDDVTERKGKRERPVSWWRGKKDKLIEMAQGTTPCYVYHLPTIRDRARSLAAVEAVDVRYYAIKANSHPTILKTLFDEGFGLECVSLAELKHVFTFIPKIPPSRVLYTPSFAPISEIKAAFDLGVTVTIDSVEALKRWPEVFRGRSIWVRIDLGHGDGHHIKVNTGGKASKFGLSSSRFDEFLSSAQSLGIQINGLHAHLGSGVDKEEHWRTIFNELAHFAHKIGTSIETIDIGGGLPIPYKPEDEPFDLERWGNGLKEARRVLPERCRVAIEPGRFLVAESGALVTRATQVIEKDGIHRIGLDGGMNALIRPALYDAWHDIENLSRIDDMDRGLFDVVGPICESSDIFARQRLLPKCTSPDDVLVVSDAGAYGFVMASVYNLRPLPREEFVDE